MLSGIGSAVGNYPPIDPSMVLYYHLNNNISLGENSTNAYDYSGKGNNGTIIQSSFDILGGIFQNGALNFNGINSSVTIPSTVQISPLTNYTQCAWAKSNGQIVDGAVFSSTSTPRSYITFKNNALLRADFGSPASAIANSGFINNTWYWVCNVVTNVNTTTANGTFYINSKVIGSIIFNGTSNLSTLALGKNGAALLNGTINEVIIWNRGLTNLELNSIYINYTTSEWNCLTNQGNFTIDQYTGLISSAVDTNMNLNILGNKSGLTFSPSKNNYYSGSNWQGDLGGAYSPSKSLGIIGFNNLTQSNTINVFRDYNITYRYTCNPNTLKLDLDIKKTTTGYDYVLYNYFIGLNTNLTNNYYLTPPQEGANYIETARLIQNSSLPLKIHRGVDQFSMNQFTIFNKTFAFTYFIESPMEESFSDYLENQGNFTVWSDGILYFNSSMNIYDNYNWSFSFGLGKDIQNQQKEVYLTNLSKDPRLQGNYWHIHDVTKNLTTGTYYDGGQGFSGNISNSKIQQINYVHIDNWINNWGNAPVSGSWYAESNQTYLINVSYMNSLINNLRSNGFYPSLYTYPFYAQNGTALSNFSDSIATQSNGNPIVKGLDIFGDDLYVMNFVNKTGFTSWGLYQINQTYQVINTYPNISGIFLGRIALIVSDYSCTNPNHFTINTNQTYCTIQNGYNIFFKNISEELHSKGMFLVTDPRSNLIARYGDATLDDPTGINGSKGFIAEGTGCRLNNMGKPCFMENEYDSPNGGLLVQQLLSLAKFWGIQYETGDDIVPNYQSTPNDIFLVNKTATSNLTNYLDYMLGSNYLIFNDNLYSIRNLMNYSSYLINSYLTTNIRMANTSLNNNLFISDIITISDNYYYQNNYTTNSILQLYNKTESLVYFSNNSIACSDISNCNGNINITLTPNNYSYILDNFNLTEGVTRQFSPLSISGSSTSKTITSQLSQAINATVVVNVGKCNFDATYNNNPIAPTSCSGTTAIFDLPDIPNGSSLLILSYTGGIPVPAECEAGEGLLAGVSSLGKIGNIAPVLVAVTAIVYLIFGFKVFRRSGNPKLIRVEGLWHGFIGLLMFAMLGVAIALVTISNIPC